MKFEGMLMLGTAPGAIARQLSGEALSLDEAGPLRSDISTDEITPIPTLLNFDATLARYAHTGTVINGERPFGEDVLARAGVSVLVAGRRYGKGSSREHSPLAEKSVGIRLVIAESFERIYRQNCDNLGLFTSTDMGLADRIAAGEEVTVDELVAGPEPLAGAILREGGLLAYGQKYLTAASPALLPQDRPMTLAQKIVTRQALAVEGLDWAAEPGTRGFVRADFRFIHEYDTGMAALMLHERFGRPLARCDPQSIILFEDHNSYAHRSPTHVNQGLLPQVRTLSQAHRDFGREYGYLIGEEGSEGISHAMMAENYTLPGRIVVGTDSHTPRSGAVGYFAYGVGTTDMANAFMTGAIRLTMAEGLLVRLEGAKRPGVTAKDIVLALLATEAIRQGAGVGKSFEFAGPVVDAMSIDERATLTNMVAELGGLTGICAPDAETVRFLRERRDIEIEPEPWMVSDPGAAYAEVITLDCAEIGPMLARPGDSGNGVAIKDLDEVVHPGIAMAVPAPPESARISTTTSKLPAGPWTAD